MLFKQVLKLESDKISILEQKKVISIFNNVDIYNYTVENGGCTVLNDELWVNYSHNKDVLWYDINHIKMLIPEKIYHYEYSHIQRLLDIMNTEFYTIDASGYWMDELGHQILDELIIIEFKINSLEKLNFFIKLASRLAEEYGEDCIALYINDALLLIKGGI